MVSRQSKLSYSLEQTHHLLGVLREGCTERLNPFAHFANGEFVLHDKLDALLEKLNLLKVHSVANCLSDHLQGGR